MHPACYRTATISNFELITWHPFPQLYVGVVIYDEKSEWTLEEYLVRNKRKELIQRERSWWQDLEELQRFIPNSS